MDDPFLNQKANENIQITYSLKYKLWKKNLYEVINGSVGWNEHSFDTLGLHLFTFRILEPHRILEPFRTFA